MLPASRRGQLLSARSGGLARLTEVSVLKGRLMHPVLAQNLPGENTAQSNIERGVAVRIILMTASFTEKLMTIAIRLFSMTTNITPPACASWLNFDNLKAVVLSLIGRKLFEYKSGPFVNGFALFLSQLATIGNALKSFNCNGWIARFSGKFDNPFRDNVHGIFGESRLLSALPLEYPSYTSRGGLCLLPLETCASQLVTAANVLKPFPVKELCTFAIGHNCNVIDAPIHADNGVIGLINIRDGFGEGYRKIDLTLSNKQPPTAHCPVRINEIVLQLWRGLVGYALNPTARSGYTQPVFQETKVTASDSTLQTNGGVFELDRLGGFLFKFSQGKVFSRYLAKAANQYLRGKMKAILHIVIGELLQFGRISNTTVIKSHLASPVASKIPFLNRELCKVFIKLDF